MTMHAADPSLDFIARVIETSQKIPLPCCLCDAQTHNRGVFVPKNPTVYGASPGQQRFLVYPLCERHQLTRAVMDEIEKKLAEWIEKNGLKA